MPNEPVTDHPTIVDLRAWQMQHGQPRLVAERLRTAEGSTQVVWHVPEAEIRGLLWIERVDCETSPSD